MMRKKEGNEILLIEGNLNDVELAAHALPDEHRCNRIQVARGGEEAMDFPFCGNAHRERDPDNHTKQDQGQGMVQGYLWGANSCIQKPVDFDQFRSTINQLGYYSLPVNRVAPPKSFEKTNGGRPA